MISKLERFVASVSIFFGYIAMLLMLLMAFHITSSVVWRLFTNRDIPLTLEMTAYYYMVSLTFFPLAFIGMKDKHIRADFLYVLFPTNGRKVIDLLINISLSLYFVVLTWRSLSNAIDRTKYSETISTLQGDFMVWPARWAVPIGLSIAAAYTVLYTYTQIVQFFGASSGDSSQEMKG